MDKFRNKFRNDSARAHWWDYSANGCYFITICTANREHLFGKIAKSEMHLSAIGQIVQIEFEKSFEIRCELFCDAFVIMPNHIHALLRIDHNGNMDTMRALGTHGRASLKMENRASPQMENRTSPQMENRACPQLQPTGIATRPSKSISSFVAGFKSSATKKINEFRQTPRLPVWQSRFHDHIVRDGIAYENIKRYIENNPMNWERDSFFRK